MQKSHTFILYFLILICLGMTGYSIWKTPDKLITSSFLPDAQLIQSMPTPSGDSVRLFDLPRELTFAGENVPLEIYDVRERLEREIYVNAYWQSNMILLMKRSSKYLPEIEEMLKINGIPDDFKYLAMAES